MTAFLCGRLRVEKVGDYVWQLLAPVIFVGRYGVYVVPVGYQTDFASVPRLLWWFTPKSGRWDLAAVVHDWLLTDALPAGTITSPRVDREFREALKALDVGFIRRWLMWAGVRWAAVLSTARRPGWFRTLPLLLLVTATTLAPLAALLWFVF